MINQKKWYVNQEVVINPKRVCEGIKWVVICWYWLLKIIVWTTLKPKSKGEYFEHMGH